MITGDMVKQRLEAVVEDIECVDGTGMAGEVEADGGECGTVTTPEVGVPPAQFRSPRPRHEV